MRTDHLIVRIGQHLALTVVAPLAGGEFGAFLVMDCDGRELVLKAVPSRQLAGRYARGARMAMRMRELGYPAPEYFGSGTWLDASWSLQERLPGTVPDTPTAAHIRAMVGLAERHAGAADARDDMRPLTSSRVASWLATITDNPLTRPFAGEISSVLHASHGVELLEDGVVHGDFHHRNFLAVGDQITGVFDWDGARVGDWREDLVNLAFWCALLPEIIPPDAGEIAIRRMHEVCPADTRAFFAAAMSARQLDFDVREHPERLAKLTTSLETAIAPWWRDLL